MLQFSIFSPVHTGAFDLSRTKADHKSSAEIFVLIISKGLTSSDHHHHRRCFPNDKPFNTLGVDLFICFDRVTGPCMAQTWPHVKSWKQITLKYGLLFPHYSPWVLQFFSVSSAISALLWFPIDEALAFVIYVQHTWMETRNLSNWELKKERKQSLTIEAWRIGVK